MRVRRSIGWRLVALAAILPHNFAQPSEPASLEEQVNLAIERGVVAARKHLGTDGAGTTEHHEAYPEGDTALLLYTLVKSGVANDDVQVKAAIEWLRTRKFAKTYSAAMVVLALDAMKDRQFDPQIRSAAEWIEKRFHESQRRWAYPDGDTDLSNTQVAALALWTAERHGWKARDETWESLITGVRELQNPGGSFSYRAGDTETGSMTVAGLTVLEFVLARMPDGARRSAEARRVIAARDLAWSWLERRFAVDGNPHGPAGRISEWREYYLYGIERLAAITGRKRIGDHDWYAEGARQLVADQRDDGSWGDPWDTCFALLFLRRATLTSMGGDAKPAEGTGVASAAKPTRPSHEVRWLRRWLVTGPVPDPADTHFDRPPIDLAALAPIAGALAQGSTWKPQASRERWVRLGDPARPVERSTHWAFTYLRADAACDAVLWIGRDDGIRVVLDGKAVIERHFHDGAEWDAHAVPIHLEPGDHRMLVQVENWGGTSAFAVRVARPDGSPVPGLRPFLEPGGRDLEPAVRAHPAMFGLAEVLRTVPADRRLTLSFDSADDMDRLMFDADRDGFPCRVRRSEDAADQRANPGATGLVGLHPDSPELPATIYWRIRVPAGARSKLRIRASASAWDPGSCDTILQVSVYDGETRSILTEPVGPDDRAAAANWKWYEADLSAWAGRDVVLLVQARAGGQEGWYFEDLWLDAIEVRGGS